MANNLKNAAWYGNSQLVITRATEALPQTTTKVLFTVSGGSVLLKTLVGLITANVGGVANTTNVLFQATALCTGIDITGDTAGVRYTLPAAFGSAMVETAVLVPMIKLEVDVCLPAGNIILNCLGSDGGGGRIEWSMTYVPLSATAVVTAP
jgi:hypothetical protein